MNDDSGSYMKYIVIFILVAGLIVGGLFVFGQIGDTDYAAKWGILEVTTCTTNSDCKDNKSGKTFCAGTTCSASTGGKKDETCTKDSDTCGDDLACTLKPGSETEYTCQDISTKTDDPETETTTTTTTT